LKKTNPNILKDIMNLQEKDLKTLANRGKTPEKLTEELRMLAEGFPYLHLEAPATPGNGLQQLSDEEIVYYTNAYNKFISEGGKPLKMVPASGAASRMFKNLFAFVNSDSNIPNNDFIKTFFEHIEEFAFFPILNKAVLTRYGKSIATLMENGKYKEVVETLLNNDGLNYGNLPKALLEFHKTLGSTRTPLEEHLAEGAMYAADRHGNVHIHYTVSNDHIPLVERKIEEAKAFMQHRYSVAYDITLSVQKPSTDTIAANLDGTPYRENGELFFRPGGHGALIENLNDLSADIVFIKNIDNVVPDDKRDDTVKYKRVLAGVLVAMKKTADNYCRMITEENPSDTQLDEMIEFLRTKLSVTHDNTNAMTHDEKAKYIFDKLNRPMRVCGMVKNEGEPGGGPFLVYNPDGTVSPQILESTQINPEDPQAMSMLSRSGHFNPVDLVCALYDYKGAKFNLPDYVDPTTGFISSKSRAGVEIKALELPGLWNGAMSRWNTIFVEVPASTFNPVKTVNDLLRPAHQ
jgi:hypothetical protein